MAAQYALNFKEFVASLKKQQFKERKIFLLKLPEPELFFADKNWKSKNTQFVTKVSEQNHIYLKRTLKLDKVDKVEIDGFTLKFMKSSKKASNMNALGKKLADAGELATVQSLSEKVESPKDTKQKIFIDNPEAFIAWKPTFTLTKEIIEAQGIKINNFDVIHDATDKSDFTKIIEDFTKKIRKAKDSWNPADIFMVKKTNKKEIVSTLRTIVDSYEGDTLAAAFNAKIYQYYEDQVLYPISLKQVTAKKAKWELTNVPGRLAPKYYEIGFDGLKLDFSLNTKELGVFVFLNKDTKKKINLQVRGFPHSYTVAQTEITSDGSKTGGRLGKVPTSVVDAIMGSFDDSRIKSISYFGKKPNYFDKFGANEFKETVKWHNFLVKQTEVRVENPVKIEEYLRTTIEIAKDDQDVAAILAIKIQALKIGYFFYNNRKDVDTIINKMILGAKKISTDNGFFIKVY